MMTILLVDDDEDDVEIFTEVVKDIDQSIVVMTANNGLEALAILHSEIENPRFIFLDINMPKMDGLECLEHIRQTMPHLTSRVIIYSTAKDFNFYNRSVQLGADFLTKPDDYTQLSYAIKTRISA